MWKASLQMAVTQEAWRVVVRLLQVMERQAKYRDGKMNIDGLPRQVSSLPSPKTLHFMPAGELPVSSSATRQLPCLRVYPASFDVLMPHHVS